VRSSIALVISFACFASACSRSDGATRGERVQPAIPVVTAPVVARAVPVVLTELGTVESTGSVAIRSRVDGAIVRVFVQDGQDVRAGEPLFQIDPAPLDIQLRMAQATLARDEAALENARSKAARGESLRAQKYISEDDYTQLKTNLEAAKATVDSDRAAVDNAQLQRSYTTITAPVAGKIGHIQQQLGNMVHASEQAVLTTLNVLDTVDVSFAIPAQALADVQAAMASAKPTVEVAKAADGIASKAYDPPLTGALTFVDNAADPSTGTIRLRARFDNRPRNGARALWPGELINVRLTLPTAAQSIVVPSSAIAEGPRGSYVYVVRADNTAEQRDVAIVRAVDPVSIVTGVNAGEQVVVDGQSNLSPNAAVAVHAPAAP